MESAAIRVGAHRDDPERLALALPGTEEPVEPTHWRFGQLGMFTVAEVVDTPAQARSSLRRASTACRAILTARRP